MAVTHSVVLYDPTETSAEVKAAAGFLAGYSGHLAVGERFDGPIFLDPARTTHGLAAIAR